jgi:histidinol phosphatase-like enzyme (inositol monophosphatase family)
MQAVAEVARRAGKVAMSHYRSRLSIETKKDGSPVTAADRAAEQAAREWVEGRFPEDGVIGEEYGKSRPDAARQWIVDPIDGTKSFVRGVPLWGTLIAVLEGERVLAGAAFFPAVDELVAAAPGLGCWWNGTRCSVSAVGELAKATALTTDERFPANDDRRARWSALASRVAVSRTWGDCYGYLLVATGRAEVMADDVVAAWDAAPFIPIIQEAGGVFTDWRGSTSHAGRDIIATNALLANEVRTILGVTAAPGDVRPARAATAPAAPSAERAAREELGA